MYRKYALKWKVQILISAFIKKKQANVFAYVCKHTPRYKKKQEMH